MKFKILLIAVYAIFMAGCNSQQESDSHNNAATVDSEHDHAHEDVKVQLLAYTDKFEVFAEADPFVTGKEINILSHFTTIPDFKPLIKGIISIKLEINGKTVKQTLKNPSRKGIYSFKITPDTPGEGMLTYTVYQSGEEFQIVIPDIKVFSDSDDAIHYYDKGELSDVNTTSFTKEQSWKIDFSTSLPETGEFGQTIKTTAKLQPSLEDEVLILAKTSGVVMQSTGNIHAGTEVLKNQVIFNISGNLFAEDNSSVKYSEAKNNYDLAKAEYDRHVILAKDKIISDRELLLAKKDYDNAKAIYDNLSNNFNPGGQQVKSPDHGFVTELYFENGQYVKAGDPLVRISKNKHLALHAGVQQKYANVLGSVKSANIRTLYDGRTYSMKELDGKIISYGRTTNTDNYLIPVCIEIQNKYDLLPGSFVEVYLKTVTNSNAIFIPNSSIIEEQGNFFVFVQITPELFEKREVNLGENDGNNSEILSGIISTERIVTKGAMLIKLSQATGTLDAHSGHVH